MKTHEKVGVTAALLLALLALGGTGITVYQYGRFVTLMTPPEPEPVLIEPAIEIEGFSCYRRRGTRPQFDIENYEVEIVVICPPDVLSSWYIAEVPPLARTPGRSP